MRRFKILLFALFACGLYFLWSTLLLPLGTDYTQVCGSCHAPALAYRTKSRSQHRQLSCLACHRGSGLSRRLSTDIRAWRNIGSMFAKTPPQERYVENDVCLACHDEIIEETVRSKAMRMRHWDVIEAGWRCGDCHGSTGHRVGNVKDGLKTASMDKCFRCHLKKKKLRKCELCHIGKIHAAGLKNPDTMGSLAHTKDWVSRRHGRADNQLCLICHDREFCRRCHQVPLPHPRYSWPFQHGAAAVRVSDSCEQCHEKKFCRDCHGETMPHTDDFEQNHAVAKSNGEVCLGCHFQDQCEECHQNHLRHQSKNLNQPGEER